MPNLPPQSDPEAIKRRALATWDNEGGAKSSPVQSAPIEIPALGEAEIVQLRIRVIALENLMIAVLAEGSERQIQVAQEMAKYISPRAGMTHHPLTIRAADHMTDMVARAEHFRGSLER